MGDDPLGLIRNAVFLSEQGNTLGATKSLLGRVPAEPDSNMRELLVWAAGAISRGDLLARKELESMRMELRPADFTNELGKEVSIQILRTLSDSEGGNETLAIAS